jgi:iron complex outermembrane receptor protein
MRALAGILVACAGAPLAAADALDDIVVTARRLPEPRLEFPGSLARVDASTIALTGATHHAELLDRIAGVYVQRGSGQESLTAIRSPVLSGPGACGAFLVLEDGLPTRPVGFCNVNELFELNLEQASAVEVIRGPGPAIYGANAVHGLVNVITPAASDLAPFAVAGEAGSHDYRRVKLAAGTRAGVTDLAFYGVATRDGGFRAESGFDEAKLNLLADRELGAGTLRVRAAGTVLNQETAGFVRGFDAYRDPGLRESNPNPESYRDAWSARLAAHWERAACEGCADAVRVLARRSNMNFLQHFLIGQPVEDNGQSSVLVAASMQRPLGSLELRGGVDLERSDTELLEIQAGPVVGSPPPAAGIRPAGRHYDYSVEALTSAAFGAVEWTPAPRWRVGAAARIEETRYDYDNHMLAGNTDEAGVPCGFGGCLYSRPASREDEFANFAPKVDVRYAMTDRQRLYAAAGRGFRPPEMTELYRLQRQQSLAELDSERLDSLELGWIGRSERVDWTLAAYALEKDHVILRDANAFNVSDGRTRHRGVEYELAWRMSDRWQVLASGTFARHTYAFTRAVEAGESITDGDDVDTAPRSAHHVSLGASPLPALALELEVAYVGEYFVDAANAARYPGHALLNARARYTIGDAWHTTLRVTNLTDRRYADRADFAFGDYRYFPGRERSAFLEIGYSPRR